jgi:actin-related protein
MLRPTLLLVALTFATLPGHAQVEDGHRLARFRMDQLQQTASLPEDQARIIVDRWTRYDRDQLERAQQVRQIRRRFNEILLGPGTEEEKSVRVKPLLEQFMDLRRQQAELKLRFEDDIRLRLSPAQQVRLILQVEEMQRRVLEALRQGETRPMPAPRQGMGPRRMQP